MGEAEQPSSLSLTVLHLYEENPPVALEKIHSLLYPHQCRVLEVDDLEQADLLARVWKPNVVLLGGKFSDPIAYAWQLSQYPFLSALPLVTLTPEITQAANQVPGLSLFPCLVSIATHRNPTSGSGSPEISALWQVIQMAAGISWTPHILVTDFSTLEENLSTMAVPSGGQTIPEFKASHSIGALVQYMQMAGFRSSIGHSWHDITRQLQHCSVDLWLLCVHSAEPHPLLLEIIQRLEQLEVKPPILVWNCQVAGEGGNAETRSFEAMWGAIATRILPPSLSITELPDRINQALMNWQM